MPRKQLAIKIVLVLTVVIGAVFLYNSLSQKWSKENSRSRGLELVLIWSPDMPLSLSSIAQISKVSDRKGIPLRIYLDPYSDEGMARRVAKRAGLPQYTLKEMDLKLYKKWGANQHSPALFLVENDKPIGSPILGYNTNEQYQNLIKDKISAGQASHKFTTYSFKKCSDQSIHQLSKIKIESEELGAFHQPLAIKKYTVFATGSRSWTVNLENGNNHQGPSDLDPIFSPDEKLVLTAKHKMEGLRFYSGDEWMAFSPTIKPLFDDKDFSKVTYQSIGNLSQERYRVIGRSPKGLVYREYQWKGGPVKPLTELKKLCPHLDSTGHNLSLPLLSKDGQHFFARNDRDGGSGIFSIDDQGNCQEKVQLPFSQMGKGNLSFTGTKIAFHNSGESGLNQNSAYVYDWSSQELWEISSPSEDHRNMFPAFQKDGNLVVLSRPFSNKPLDSYFIVVKLKDCL